MNKETSNPISLDSLTPEQRERLQSLSASLSFDKITVSFSIEDRDGNGRKKSAFYSVTGSRGHGAELTQLADSPGGPAGYTEADARLVHCILSKHVVSATYSDAVRRGIIRADSARTELKSILQAYDSRMLTLLSKESGSNAT